MASANVDLVRSIYAAWARGDYGSTAWAHPEIEFVIADGPNPGSYGLGEIAEGWRDFLSAWREWRVEPEEFRELDDDRVLVLVQFSARGKSSGLELRDMRAKGASVFHVRDGKVARQVLYLERERALAELGLGPRGAVDRGQ